MAPQPHQPVRGPNLAFPGLLLREGNRDYLQGRRRTPVLADDVDLMEWLVFGSVLGFSALAIDELWVLDPSQFGLARLGGLALTVSVACISAYTLLLHLRRLWRKLRLTTGGSLVPATVQQVSSEPSPDDETHVRLEVSAVVTVGHRTWVVHNWCYRSAALGLPEQGAQALVLWVDEACRELL